MLKIAGEEYLTVLEASEQMGVNRWTINRWRKEGKIKAHKLGKRVLYKPSDLAQAIQEEPTNLQPATEPANEPA